MKATIAIAIAAAITAGNAFAAEASAGATAPTAWVTHYAPGEGFYHVVADKRFVGWYAPTKGTCSVNLLVGPANEHDADHQPMHLTVDVRPSQSLVMQAGNHQSLDIACGVKADGLAIRTVPGAGAGLAQTN